MSGCTAHYHGGGGGTGVGGGGVIHVGGGGGHHGGVILSGGGGGGGVHHGAGVAYGGGGGSISVETVKESLTDRLTGKITSFFDRLTESFDSVKRTLTDRLPTRQASHVTSELYEVAVYRWADWEIGIRAFSIQVHIHLNHLKTVLTS